MKRTQLKSTYIAALLIGAASFFTSCNKEVTNQLKEYTESDVSQFGKAKILYIVVDGLSGSDLQKLETPRISEIGKSSLYSFSSLADANTTNLTKESAWTTLLTGVNPQKHGVSESDLSSTELAKFPSIFSRINQVNGQFRSAVLATDARIIASLGKDAQVKTAFTTDVQLQVEAIKTLKDSEEDLTVLHYSAVDQAGKTSGYSINNATYVSAIRQLDTQIGDLMTTIKARPSYAKENWLVIITSSTGADLAKSTADNTVYGDPKRNTFTMFYSPKFETKYVNKPTSTEIPFEGNAVRYTYNGTPVQAKLADLSAFNFGVQTDYTINLFIKYTNPGVNLYYPSFFSKRAVGFSGPGWNMFSEGNYWMFNSNMAGQVKGAVINDGKWHSLTVVIDRAGSLDSIRAFTDGTFNAAMVANGNNPDNQTPIRVGKIENDGNTNADYSIANIQIFNRAFTKEEVKKLAGIVQVDEGHPHFNSLQGYWPGFDDVGKNVLTDKSINKRNLSLTGPYNWSNFSDVVSHFQPAIAASFYRLVPNGVDAPFMVYQWLGITVPSSWQLDGKGWAPAYRTMRD